MDYGKVNFYWKLFKDGGGGGRNGVAVPVIRNGFDQKHVYLGLFLDQLLRLPASEWTNLDQTHFPLNLTSELVAIACQHLCASPRQHWLLKLLLLVLAQLKPEQINEHRLLGHLLTYLSECLRSLSLVELEQLLSDPLIVEELNLEHLHVTLLSKVPGRRKSREANGNESSSTQTTTPELSPSHEPGRHISPILAKYNELVLLHQQKQQQKQKQMGNGKPNQNGHGQKNCDDEGETEEGDDDDAKDRDHAQLILTPSASADCNLATVSMKNNNKRINNNNLQCIESEIPPKEIILLAMRLIVNILADCSLTNYCKDYQLTAIITGALGHYAAVSAESTANGSNGGENPTAASLHRQFYLKLIAVAVLRSFQSATPLQHKPIELVRAIKKTLEAGSNHLLELKSTNSDSVVDFHWTFLLMYLINNLQYTTHIDQSELLNKFNEVEPAIIRTTCELLATEKTKAFGMNVINLLTACHENYKESSGCSSAKRVKLRGSQSRRRQVKSSNIFTDSLSVHHQPMLGSYKRFDCLAEHCLFELLSIVHKDEVQLQWGVLRGLAKGGICCCTATRRNLSVLWRLAYTQQFTAICLHILRNDVYRLVYSPSKSMTSCRLCAEKLGDCLENDLLVFYQDAIRTMPRRQVLMMHLQGVLRCVSVSVQMRLVLEVVWKYFCDEVAKEEEEQNNAMTVVLRRKPRADAPESIRHCLVIFGKALQQDPQLVKVLLTKASVELIIKCRSKWPELSQVVCEIFFRGLQNARSLNDYEDRGDLMDAMLDEMVRPCVQATQLAQLFLRERMRTVKWSIFEEREDYSEFVQGEFLNDGGAGILDIVQLAVVLWKGLGRIMELNEEEIDEYLEERFMTKAKLFDIICMAIVFVLDVVDEEEEQLGSDPVLVDELVRRMDRLTVERRGCDKYLLLERNDAKDETKKTAAIDFVLDINLYQQVSVFQEVSSHLVSFEEVIGGRDVTRACDILVGDELSAEDRVRILKGETETKRGSFSMVENVINSVRERTGRLYNQYVVDNWRSLMEPVQQQQREERDEVCGEVKRLREEFAKVKVSTELRMRVGQLLEAAMKVFVMMQSAEDFGARMLPALAELKRYLLEQSIESWNSAEHARTVTRTLESILKVAEQRLLTSASVDEEKLSFQSGWGGRWTPSVFESDSGDEDREEKDDELSEEEDDHYIANLETDKQLITFKTTSLDEAGSVSGGGYEADTEQKISDEICSTDDDNDNEDNGVERLRTTTAVTTEEISGQHLHEGVCQIIMEILFELSKKCVADPLLWSNNLNTILNHLATVSRTLRSGTEAILRGFALVLQARDPRLRELQKSILELVDEIVTPGSLTAFMSLFTAENAPVDLLLPKFYEITVARMEVQPVCELEFPTRNDNSHQILCDQSVSKSVFSIRDYHRSFKLESPFTMAALICPMNTIRFKPWTNPGFTVTAWMKWKGCGGGFGARPKDSDNKLHVWSVGSNKVILTIYLDAERGQLFVEITRPNVTLTKETISRKRNGSVGVLPKKGSSVTNLFMKTMRVDYPEYFITKSALPLGRKLLEGGKWQHLAWSVAMFPEQIVLVMTVNGGEQHTVQIRCENAVQAAKNANLSVLCVGETNGGVGGSPLWSNTGSYCLANLMLFKKSIPEVQVLAELMSYGPDFTNPGRCQIEQRVANRGLVRGGGGLSCSVLFVEMDAEQVIRDNLLVTYSAKNVNLMWAAKTAEALGFIAFGRRLVARKLKSFATNLVVSGGLDVLLFLFARVVEMPGVGKDMQALALKSLLEAAHRNMFLFADFKRRHVSAISSVLRTSLCDKSLHMLKVILDVAFDEDVLEVVDNGRSYKIKETQRESRLVYPELIIATINNFEAWIDENGEEEVIEVLFEVLIWLNVSSVQGGGYSKRQLLQANVVDAILSFCKMHVGGISSRIRVTQTMAQRLVELLGIYGPTPPRAEFLDELAKLLLLIHEPSCVFVTQDRVNYYYLLAACPPDKSKLGLGRRAAERWTKGLWMIQRKRRAGVVERSRNASQESLWKPRGSLWDMGEASGVAAVPGRTKQGRKRRRRLEENVRESVMEMTKVKEGDKMLVYKGMQCRTVVKLNRAIHNKKVTRRRRTIERRTPLYNRLGAHVRKKENKNPAVDVWTLNLRRLGATTSTGESASTGGGASTLQKELLRLLQTYIILLPDNMVAEVLDHYVTIDLLLILANNVDGGVRAQLLRLLEAMCERMDSDRFDALLDSQKLVHLANQLLIYPVTLEMVMACRQWVQAAMGQQQQLKKRNVGLIFLVALLPSLVAKYESTLIGCLQLMSELYEVCSTTRKFLMQRSLLLPTLVKCWLKMFEKRPFLKLNQRPGNHLLLFSYQICKSLFLSGSGSASGSGVIVQGGGADVPANSWPTIWDFLNGLDYVGTASLVLPVRRGMRVIQAKILNGLLRKCLQRGGGGGEPHERYMNGLRKLQAMSMIFTRTSSIGSAGSGSGGVAGGGGTEMKAKFNQLMEKSILFVQCKDSQYEPRPAEEDLVKTVIRLGLATKLKIGPVLIWAMSPFRSIELRLFVIKCLTHLMRSKHVKTYGLKFSIIRIFTKKFLGDVKAAEVVTPSNVALVKDFARFLNTHTSVDLWALLKAMSQIDEISYKVKEDAAQEIERSVHKYEAIAANCQELSVELTRRFVEGQNTERRDLINQLRAEKRHNYQWRALISRMTHENAPFHNPRYFPNSWEMDETEGPSRVRLRMKRCFPPLRNGFLLPEFRELHEGVTREQPLQYLVEANVRLRSSITDQVLYNFQAAQIKGDSEVKGDLVITETVITFFPDNDHSKEEPLVIETTNVIDIWLRRYLHEEKCVELFLTSGHTVLFMLHDPNDRKTFVAYFGDKVFDPSTCKWHMFVMQQWREGQLTNWEYLTALNQLGGRSFQDLMQYPVFPWILADYESSILDLKRKESFRCLERPIAVQHDESRAYYEAGYEHLASSNFGASNYNVSHFPYHFPCHYSNSGTVLSFLIRVPPYTQMFVRYQDNHFDLPDRTFFALHHAWRLSSRESTTDVKELLPEFFTLPEMFENGEGFDFGVCQGGERVNHVNLPAWSNHSARLFTLVHRQALESDFVRENLRHWVDLVFGFKQTGEAAIQATNVFHSATYPEFAQPPSDDPLYKTAYATMVRTYGQMPKQLLQQPHPESLVRAMSSNSSSGENGEEGVDSENGVSHCCGSVRGLKWGKYTGSPELPAPVRVQLVRCAANTRRIVCLETTNTVYAVPEHGNYMQGLEMDTINCVTWRNVDGVVRVQRLTSGQEAAQENQQAMTGNLFVENGQLDEITCCGTHVNSSQLWLGYASGRIVVYAQQQAGGGGSAGDGNSAAERLNRIRYLQNSYLANTMSYNSAFRMFKSTGTSVGGSANGWNSQQHRTRGKRTGGGGDEGIGQLRWQEEVTLLFHTDKVVDIRISPEFRIAVSVGVDGRAAIWDTNHLEYVRQIQPPSTTALINRIPIALLAISQTMGDIVTVHRGREEEEEEEGNRHEDDDGMDLGAGATTDDESYEVTENNIDDFVKVSTTGFASGRKTLMRLHTINAKYVNHVTVQERILSLCVSHVKEGIGINVVATGFENGTIKLWSSWDLSFVRQIDTMMADVIDVCYTTYQHLVVLTRDGFIQVWESTGLLGREPKFPQIECKK